MKAKTTTTGSAAPDLNFEPGYSEQYKLNQNGPPVCLSQIKRTSKKTDPTAETETLEQFVSLKTGSCTAIRDNNKHKKARFGKTAQTEECLGAALCEAEQHLCHVTH